MQLNIFKQKESKPRYQEILLFKGPLNFYFSRSHIETFGYSNETAQLSLLAFSVCVPQNLLPAFWAIVLQKTFVLFFSLTATLTGLMFNWEKCIPYSVTTRYPGSCNFLANTTVSLCLCRFFIFPKQAHLTVPPLLSLVYNHLPWSSVNFYLYFSFAKEIAELE